MNLHVFQILVVVGIRCRAIVLPNKGAELLDAGWLPGCGAPPPRYANISCTEVESLQLGGGVIIAGQGGSATRAAQEVVQFTGRTFFGKVDYDTYDSCATRWGQAPYSREPVIESTGSVDYHVSSIPQEVRFLVKNATCKTLAILQKMADENAMESSGKRWALKEPWLRFLLPFYTQNLNIKFVHVTRDLRMLQDTHNDETLIGPHLKDLEEFSNLDLPPDYIGLMRVAGRNAFSKVKDSLDVNQFSVEEFEKYSMFAQVWANVEVTLHNSWKKSQPQNYFHLSEKHMTNQTINRDYAKKLAGFLGNLNPSEDTLQKMLGVYRPDEVTTERRHHWNLMQIIIEEPSNGKVREALHTFGYEISPKKPWEHV